MGPHPYLQGGMPQMQNAEFGRSQQMTPWLGGGMGVGSLPLAQARAHSSPPAPFQSLQKGHGGNFHDAENISNIPSSAGGQRQLVGPSHPWQAG